MRQWIEAIIGTLKGQPGLERHGGRTPAGVFTRVTQRLLAMAACIWHNWFCCHDGPALADRLRPLNSRNPAATGLVPDGVWPSGSATGYMLAFLMPA